MRQKAVLMEFRGIGNLNAETIVSRHFDLQATHAVMKELHAHGNPVEWRMPNDHLRPTQNWTVDWSPVEDARLLVGIWRHGFGAWEAIQADAPLALQGKFFLDESKNKPLDQGQTRSTPTAVHLVRRGDYLAGMIREFEENDRLVKEQQAAQQRAQQAYFDQHGHYPPVQNVLPSVLHAAPGEAGPSSAPAKKPRKSTSAAPSASDKGKKRKGTPVFTDSESESDYASMDEAEAKEELRPVKSALKQLKHGTEDLPREEKVEVLKQCLIVIGKRIEVVVAHKSAKGQNGDKCVLQERPPASSTTRLTLSALSFRQVDEVALALHQLLLAAKGHQAGQAAGHLHQDVRLSREPDAHIDCGPR
jgi:chromodomain-helicase-DNA-binding protein 1